MNDFLNLPPLRKPRVSKPRPAPIPQHCKDRYQQAHELNFKTEYPSAYPDKYFQPVIPDVRKANGLTQAIVKFLLWNGHRATRISSSGRMVKGKYIPGATRRGASDISATIFGKSVQLEIKINKDQPSEFQLREQELERKAGGCYEFIHTFDQFLTWYDGFINYL